MVGKNSKNVKHLGEVEGDLSQFPSKTSLWTITGLSARNNEE